MDTTNAAQPGSSAALTCSEFVCDLYAKWCESAPYGEQVPDELPKLFREFCEQHSGKTDEEMCDAFMSVEPGDPMEQLFSCIFETAAKFTIMRLADAVYDRNKAVLRLVDLEPVGTLSTVENDPHPECPSQHIMHPNYGGIAVFQEVRLSTPNSVLSEQQFG